MANPIVTSYNPKKVIVIFGGIPITGYADGDFIEITPNDSDGVKKVIGADGEVATSESSDNTHTVTITLLQSSASNAHLSHLRNTGKLTGAIKQPLSITDINGGSLHSWPEAWIKGDPTWGYGKELKERQWTLDTGQQAVDNKSGLLP